MHRSLLVFFCLVGLVLTAGLLALYTLATDGSGGPAGAGGWLGLLAGGLLLAAAITWLAHVLFLQPVKRLRLDLNEMVEGKIAVRTKRSDSGNRDLDAVVDQVTLLQQRVQILLRQRSRLLRELPAELRAPLSRLQALASVLEQQQSARPELIAQLQAELDELHELIAEVLVYSQLERKHTIRRQPTSLRDVLHTIVVDMQDNPAAAGAAVQLADSQDTILEIDYALIHTALESIIHHAADCAAAEGSVAVSLLPEPAGAQISVRGTCTWVKNIDPAKLFQPFSHAAPIAQRKLTRGFGLPMAKRIVSLHGGTINAERSGDQELSVDVHLPMAN